MISNLPHNKLMEDIKMVEKEEAVVDSMRKEKCYVNCVGKQAIGFTMLS